ncbi:MAG: hypothetical protein FWE57_03125 [Chitinispirillia bacterium]|nr:hypothetical protein [Chitinispirillia bacterium]
MKRFITVILVMLICKVGLMADDGEEVSNIDSFIDESNNSSNIQEKSTDNTGPAAKSGVQAVPSDKSLAPSEQKAESAQINTESKSTDVEDKFERKVFITASIGTAGFINLKNNYTPYSMQYGYVMTINPFVNGRLVGELTTDFNSAILAAVECGAEILIGGNGYFTPFFGSGLGLAAARGVGKSGAGGITMSTSGGAYLFRTDLYQVNLQGRLLGLLAPIEGKYPFSYSVRIGVQF